MAEPLLARDVMTPNPMTVTADTSVAEAMGLLSTVAVRHLPVIDGARRLVGILSDRDLLESTPPPAEDPSEIEKALERRVSTVMTTEIVAAEADSPLVDVIDAMLAKRIGAIPIVDALNQVVGIVSYVDVLRLARGWVDGSAPTRPARDG